MDKLTRDNLKYHGCSEIVVVLQPTLTASSSGVKKIKNNFITKTPESYVSGVYSTKKSKPYHYFPRLGIYVGLMDSKGIKSTQQQGAKIYGSPQISLIRPIWWGFSKPKRKLTWGLTKTGIEKIWKKGITGKNVRVGHLDTGIDGKHSALKKSLVSFLETDMSGNAVPGNSPSRAYDSGEHGTHVAGTICGGKVKGLNIGVAPDAKLYSGMVIEGGHVLIRVLRGMEWSLQNKVKVLNMSLGFRGYEPFFLDVTRRLRQAGTLPVFAIGNEGSGTSRSPGNYAECLSVGAVDKNYRIAYFSSSIKINRKQEPYQPDLVGPGVDIISAKPGGDVQGMSGTSMATPHLAGIATLLFSAEPSATVSQVEKALIKSCKRKWYQNKVRYGAGVVDPPKALKILEKMIS